MDISEHNAGLSEQEVLLWRAMCAMRGIDGESIGDVATDIEKHFGVGDIREHFSIGMTVEEAGAVFAEVENKPLVKAYKEPIAFSWDVPHDEEFERVWKEIHTDRLSLAAFNVGRETGKAVAKKLTGEVRDGRPPMVIIDDPLTVEKLEAAHEALSNPPPTPPTVIPARIKVILTMSF